MSSPGSGEGCGLECSEEDDVGEMDEVEFAKEVLALLKKERKMLIEKGLDVDFMIEDIERLLQQTEDSRARMQDLKRQMLMAQSGTLIGENGPTAGSSEQLDMAAKELRKDGEVEEYYKRIRRRSTTPDANSKHT